MREFNFIHKDLPESDKDSFFGPIEKDNDNDLIVDFDDGFKLEDIWVAVGLFKSKGAAKKNGHGGLITDGWTDITKKKRGIRVCILNKFEGWGGE